MKTKHTPAPWKVIHTGDQSTEVSGHKNHYAKTWISAEGGTVAQIFPCHNPRRAFKDNTLPDTTGDELEPIGQANARLIAESPALLASLKDCAAELNQLAFLHGDSLALKTVRVALALIAKIEGA